MELRTGKVRPTPPSRAGVLKEQESHLSRSHPRWGLPPLTLLQRCQEASLTLQPALPAIWAGLLCRLQELPGVLLWHLCLGPLPSLQIQPSLTLQGGPVPAGPESEEAPGGTALVGLAAPCSTAHIFLQASLPFLVPALVPRQSHGHGNQRGPLVPPDLECGALIAYLSPKWP